MGGKTGVLLPAEKFSNSNEYANTGNTADFFTTQSIE
jgi:hypothetical protein